METINTVIEFVSSGTGGGGTTSGGGTGVDNAVSSAVAASDIGATADPLFITIAVLFALVVIGVTLFLYARHTKTVTTSAMAGHFRSSFRRHGTYTKGNKSLMYLIAIISITITATCFAICWHNNAIAEENDSVTNGIATISDKVIANVDDSGTVTFDKGIITNNDGELSIGTRQVKSNTTIDLTDSILQITCNNQELFNKSLGETQLNDSYITVPVEGSADLMYTIKIPAEKAKMLIGTEPITLSTDVDLVVTKPGMVKDALGEIVEGAKVTYTYTDPYDDSKLVSGETTTDENGEYKIPDVKKGSKVTVEICYKAGEREYYSKQENITFDDEKTPLDTVVPKTEPKVEDFIFTAPGTPGQPIVYNGNAKVAEFNLSEESPAGMGSVSSIEYSSDGGKTWSFEAKNAATYQVRINVEEGTGTTKVDGLTHDDWTFTIAKSIITVTPDADQSKAYDGTTAQPTYKNEKPVSTETPAFEGNLGLKDNAEDAGTYEIVQNTLALKDNESFKADNYQIKLPETAVKYTIVKAKNNMVFNLITKEGTSTYSASTDASQKIEAATGAPTSEVDKVSYKITNKTVKENANFNIIVDETTGTPFIVCKAGTPQGTYELLVQATSGGKNYESKTIPESDEKNFTWTVKNKVSYKPIQTTVGTDTVTFLPAYSDDTCPYKFYTKSGETYTEITGITDMASLASKIGSKEAAANVYTDAKDAIFYGTINRTWNNTFYQSSAQSGDAEGLNSDFKIMIENAGVKTVYGDYVDGTWVIDGSHNWNAADTSKEPDLTGVDYNSFYAAYKALLSSIANFPWSSRASSSYNAYRWFVSSSSGDYGIASKDSHDAVVLSRAF